MIRESGAREIAGKSTVGWLYLRADECDEMFAHLSQATFHSIVNHHYILLIHFETPASFFVKRDVWVSKCALTRVRDIHGYET